MRARAQLEICMWRVGHSATVIQCVGQFNISPGSVVNHTNACLRAVNDRLSGLIHLPRNEAEVREAQASFNQEGTDHSVCPGFMAAGDGSLVQVGAGQYCVPVSAFMNVSQHRVAMNQFAAYNSGRIAQTCVNIILVRCYGVTCAELCSCSPTSCAVSYTHLTLPTIYSV